MRNELRLGAKSSLAQTRSRKISQIQVQQRGRPGWAVGGATLGDLGRRRAGFGALSRCGDRVGEEHAHGEALIRLAFGFDKGT